MQKLLKYAKGSELMEVSFKIGKEIIQFNLYQELRIEDNNVNRDILGQARLYSFLGMVHAQLVERLETAEARKKEVYAKTYIKYKESTGAGGRPLSDDLAKSKAEASLKYQSVVKNYIRSKAELQKITHCLKAFEQRKDLIQSLSSNLRNNV